MRFEFDPAVVDVPPDSGAAVQVRVMAPPPAAGERSERSLTVRAIDDGTELPAVVRLIQETSAAPVEVLAADWATMLDRGPFSLLFLDSGKPSASRPDKVVELMDDGGIVDLLEEVRRGGLDHRNLAQVRRR